MASILDGFFAAVSRHPQRTAIIDGKGRETTFAQLKSRADNLAYAWHLKGVREGDRVLLAMPFNADLYAALAALWSLGATVVLPEPAMGLDGLRNAAKITGITAFCSAGPYGLLKFMLPALWSMRNLRTSQAQAGNAVQIDASDTDIALISFTSGTTGVPKAIPRTHGFLTAQQSAIAPLLTSDQQERDLVAFPVFVLINIAAGQTSVLPNWKMSQLAKLTPEALVEWMHTQKITRALIPPSVCDKLKLSTLPPSLHTVFTGGGPVFPDTVDSLKRTKPEARLCCVYGSTEAEPIAHLEAWETNDADRAEMQNGGGLLVGKPVDGLKLRLIDNEIQVAGAHVNSGYLNPAQNAANKVVEGDTVWHRTGDAGRMDAHGRLWLLGRIGSDVIVSGRRTYPFSVEVAVREWGGVAQCALIERNGHATLAIEGAADELETWQAHARLWGIEEVLHIAKMPMDKRHASKIDRAALLRMYPA